MEKNCENCIKNNRHPNAVGCLECSVYKKKGRIMDKELKALEIIDKKNVQIFDLKKCITKYKDDIYYALHYYNDIYCQLQINFLTLEEITLLKETLKYE